MHSARVPRNRRWLSLVLLVVSACTSNDSETGKDQGAVSEETDCSPKDEEACSCGKQQGTRVCSKAGA